MYHSFPTMDFERRRECPVEGLVSFVPGTGTCDSGVTPSHPYCRFRTSNVTQSNAVCHFSVVRKNAVRSRSIARAQCELVRGGMAATTAIRPLKPLRYPRKTHSC